MRELFITGGAGFIGSAFVRMVLTDDPSTAIVNFDALTYAGNPDNLQDLDKDRHHFVKGDIADREAVLSVLSEGTDAVINFAAESHGDRSIASADEFINTNVLGTHVLQYRPLERGVPRLV